MTLGNMRELGVRGMESTD
jgi:pimeloyl-ACP methyl ester carboxylesterase